jgi:hypothetical protein
MPVNEERQFRVDLFEQSRYVKMQVVNTIVDHSISSSKTVATKIYKMNIKSIKRILDCAFQMNI